jgi:hypothetical protein
MICFTELVLARDLYVVQKEEISVSCYKCDTYTWRKAKHIHKRQTHPLVRVDVCFFLGWGGVIVHLVRRPLTGLLYQPRSIDDECGAVDGMRIGRGNRSTQRKPALRVTIPPLPHTSSRGPELTKHRDEFNIRSVLQRASEGKGIDSCYTLQVHTSSYRIWCFS